MKDNRILNFLDNNLSVGKNSVLEALKYGKNIDSILVSKNVVNNTLIKNIINMAKISGIAIKIVDVKKLDAMSNNANHQGIIAITSVKQYSTIDDILGNAKEKGQSPFLVICDGVQDVHNFGAIVRTCECVGVHGIIIPKHRSVSANATVSRTSVGALEHIMISKVVNISSTIDYHKSCGIWIFGADMSGERWDRCDLKIPMALVLGSEDKGISKNVGKKCDFKISIPMFGKVNSLNVSVAAGIILYEARRQRLTK